MQIGKQLVELTEHIDTSEVFAQFYSQQPGAGLEQYFLDIEDWLEHPGPGPNVPIVFEAGEEVAKRTLLVKWMEFHKESRKMAKQPEDIVLIHFVCSGNNANYSYAIYKLLTRLRELLNLNQKVELHQEKLRKYFSYWLGICDRELQYVPTDQRQHYERVVIVIDGVDSFVDHETGKESNISLWLPSELPPRVRMIVTAQTGSQALLYFRHLGCRIIELKSQSAAKRALEQIPRSSRLVDQAVFDRQLINLSQVLQTRPEKDYMQGLALQSLGCLFPSPSSQTAEHRLVPDGYLTPLVAQIDLQLINRAGSQLELLDSIIQFWEERLVDKQVFKSLLIVLAISQKGLTSSELLTASHDSSELDLALVTIVFHKFLLRFKNYWIIRNDSFGRAVRLRYGQRQVAAFHERVVTALESSPKSIRKLEEQTFHLFMSKNYFKLKELVSGVENFLLMFNPQNKYDLCKYWQVLEDKSFDPVYEYNKTVEGFETHFHPSSDDLFSLIVQVSRFFREFSDFENYTTPRFKHARVLGSERDFQELNLFNQLRELDLLDNPGGEQSLSEEAPQEISKLVEAYFQKLGKSKCSNRKQNEMKIIKLDISQSPKRKEAKLRRDSSPLLLNLEIPINRLQIVRHYWKDVQKYLEGYERDRADCRASREEQESEGSQSKKPQFKVRTLNYSKLARSDFELNMPHPQNYYYKRWIWLQFPWVCLSLQFNYSQTMKNCFRSPTEYLSVQNQRKLTTQSLKIALQARHRKQNILESKSQQAKKSLLRLENMKTLQSRSADKSIRSKLQVPFTSRTFLMRKVLQQEIAMIPSSMLKTYEHQQNVQTHSINTASFTLKSFLTELSGRDLMAIGYLPKVRTKVGYQLGKEIDQEIKRKERLRKILDNLTKENVELARNLKNLKIIQNKGEAVKSSVQRRQLMMQIQNLKGKLKSLQFGWGYSQLQKERLKTLLYICKINEASNGEEVSILNREVANIKKMCRYLNEQIVQHRKEILANTKRSEQRILAIEARMSNEEDAKVSLQNLKQMRSNFVKKVADFSRQLSSQIRTVHQPSPAYDLKLDQKRHSLVSWADKYRKAIDDLQQTRGARKRMDQLFGDALEIEDPRVQSIKSKFQLNKQMQVALRAKSERISDLTQTKNDLRETLRVLLKASSSRPPQFEAPEQPNSKEAGLKAAALLKSIRIKQNQLHHIEQWNANKLSSIEALVLKLSGRKALSLADSALFLAQCLRNSRA